MEDLISNYEKYLEKGELKQVIEKMKTNKKAIIHLITNKIKIGKAHELSEGDTFYLGAATKGSKGGNLRGQPYSKILAKQRAYSFKQGYVNHIIASIANANPFITRFG